MQNYTDHVQDQYGNAISGASVLISQNGSPATIYSDNGVTPKANPLTTGAGGSFSFYAANGVYTLTAGEISETVTLFDSTELATAGGAALIGNAPAGSIAAETVQDAINELDTEKTAAADLAASGGAALVGYDGGTAQDVLDDAKPMQSYTALRAYTGRATGVRITSAGVAGFFARSATDVTSADNGGTIIVDGSGRRWLRLYTGAVNVKWFGAVGDGVTDDTTALQAALDSNLICLVPPGKYRTTSDLIVDPVRNRGCGFVADVSASRYPYTQQTGGPVWDGTQEAVIFYDGAASDDACVIRASAEAVGVEPAATFSNTIYGLTLNNVTLDANGKAGFGLYAVRVQDIDIDRARARGATVAGMSINGTYSGSIEQARCYLNPGRGFELGAADARWSWTAQDKVNALYIRDLHCDTNGSAGTFRQADATLKKEGCGVYFGPHRGVLITGCVSENNFGANIVYEPSGSSNEIRGLYTELGCKYAPGGAGTDAISLGYATDQIGLMFVGDTGAYHNRVVTFASAADKIWLTGTAPTAAREEGAFELQNVSLAGGLIADWGNYRLVNCAVELETISGSQPVGAYTLNGGLQFGAGLSILNHFSEGTFAPSLEGLSTAGTGWTYSIQAGVYTRIGRLVMVSGRITLSAVSGDAAGQIAIAGLPYTVGSANNYHAPAHMANVANLATSVVSFTGLARINDTRIGLYKRTAAATSESTVARTDLSATTVINFSCSYMVA
jgi:hypothetical protein